MEQKENNFPGSEMLFFGVATDVIRWKLRFYLVAVFRTFLEKIVSQEVPLTPISFLSLHNAP